MYNDERDDLSQRVAFRSPSPSARIDEKFKIAALQQQDVPLDTIREGPRFRWDDRRETANMKFSQLLKRRPSVGDSSEDELTSEHEHAKLGAVVSRLPSWSRLWNFILCPAIVFITRLAYISFMLVSCGLIHYHEASVAVVLLVGVAFYVGIWALVWSVLRPLSQSTYRARLWISSRKKKQLDHHLEQSPHPKRSLLVSRRSHQLASGDQLPAVLSPQAGGVRRAQSTLGTLPLLVWSSQAAAELAPHFTPEASRRYASDAKVALPPWKVTREKTSDQPEQNTEEPEVTELTGMDRVLHAMSQPDIGVVQKLSRMSVGSKLAPVRNDRVREVGRFFSEVDWQALLDVQTHDTSRFHRFGSALERTFRELNRRLALWASTPVSIIATIVRNLTWCALFLWATSRMQRVDHTVPWDSSRIPKSFWFLEAAFQWQMTLDHVISFVTATEKRKFLMSYHSIIDIATLPALTVLVELISAQERFSYIMSLGAFRFFRLFRVETVISNVLPQLKPVPLIISGLLIDTLVVLTAFATFMFVIEGPQPEKDFINIADYLYYSVVTMTTVGYGDYSPITKIGRWVTMAAVFAGFIIFPYHVQRLFNAFHMSPVVVGHMPSMSSDFIFIYGKMRPRQLGVMLHELCAALPGSAKHFLVVTPFPAQSFKKLTQDALWEYRINLCVSQKCPTSEELQIYCSLARAVLIFADPKVGGGATSISNYHALLNEDQKTFLRVSRAQPWCWPNVPIAVQLVHGMYQGLATEMGAYHVISLSMLKLRTIAKSLAGCPGFIPLVFNWFHQPAETSIVMEFFREMEKRKTALERYLSKKQKTHANLTQGNSEDDDDAKVDNLGTSHNRFLHIHNHTISVFAGDEKSIQDEINFYHYFSGTRYHIYRLEFPECMQGVEFSLAVRLLYRRYKVFLIGLVTIDKRFFINPIGHIIGEDKIAATPAAGIILSYGLDTVLKISRLRRFSVAPATTAAEKRFQDRNFRSPENLVESGQIFLRDVRHAKSTLIPQEMRERAEATARAVSTASRFSSRQARSDETTLAPARTNEPLIREVQSAVTAYDAADQKPLILCCGWPEDLYAFLSTIHANRPSRVLILAPEDAPAFARWNRELQRFEDSCVWMAGTPLAIEDLKNAGCLLADSIVVLACRHAAVTRTDLHETIPSIDSQGILVRQQIFALFSRVDEYLQQMNSQGATDVRTPGSSCDAAPPRLRIPMIVTELQDRENAEFLSSPKDIFLMSAFRGVAKVEGVDLRGFSFPAKIGKVDHGDDDAWAAEGGRSLAGTNDGSALKFQFSRTPLDCSGYSIHSEFRSGRLYLREMTYSLLAFCLPTSRFAIETTIIDHLIDGSNSPISNLCTHHDLKHPSLLRYRINSPISLQSLPSMFHGSPFKDVFSYLMKMELKLAIAILRQIEPGPTAAANPMELLRGSGAHEIVINCPSPSMLLIEGDMVYVLGPCPKHAIGTLYLPSAL